MAIVPFAVAVAPVESATSKVMLAAEPLAVAVLGRVAVTAVSTGRWHNVGTNAEPAYFPYAWAIWPTSVAQGMSMAP